MTKFLRERYKTYDGAAKRCRFENGIAMSEYHRGYKARLYHYTVEQEENGVYRVLRDRGEKPETWGR